MPGARDIADGVVLVPSRPEHEQDGALGQAVQTLYGEVVRALELALVLAARNRPTTIGQVIRILDDRLTCGSGINKNASWLSSRELRQLRGGR